MKKEIITMLFILTICMYSSAQVNEKSNIEIISKAILKKQLCDSIDLERIDDFYRKEVKKISGGKILKLNLEIGRCLEMNGKYGKAIEYYTKAVEYSKEETRFYLNCKLAICYFEIRDFKKSKHFAHLVLENYYQYNNDILFIKNLIILGDSYLEEGDSNRAISYIEKALSLLGNSNDNNLIRARAFRELGKVYDLLGMYDRALDFKTKALKIVLQEGDKMDAINYYNAIGLTYQKKEDYQKAMQFYSKSQKIALEKKDEHQLASILNTMGNCHYYLEDHEKASKYFLYVARLDIKLKKENTLALSQCFSKAAASYIMLKRFSEAKALIDTSLAIIKFDETKSLPFEKILGSRTSLLITLYFKAKNSHHLYLAQGCEEDLEQAHKEYDLCIRLIDYIISSFDDPDSKQYLVDRFYYVFESIIEVNYLLYKLRGERQYVERAMRYMEKSRSILLKEMMQQNKAVIMAGMPDTLLKRELELREQIAALEHRKYELEQKPAVSVPLEQAMHPVNDSLFLLRKQYWALLDEMKTRFPDYHAMKYADRSTETANIVNRLLQPKESLVQYFVGDDHIYTLVFRGDGAWYMAKQPKGKVDQEIESLRENIYNYGMMPSDSLAKAYADGAYQLYERLLQPINGYLSYRLTIIPDGLLEYLPFEGLLDARADLNSNFRAWPYCLKKHSFSYAHSVLSLEEMRERQNRPKYRQILAVAPAFAPVLTLRSPEERRRSFGALEDNLKEVNSIGALFPAKTLVGDDATVESFKAMAGDYAVLHLATHAKADNENGEYAYVAFSETKDTTQSNLLYLRNLYNLSLHADMVALSACETGVGKLRRGEGVVSLARGFSYAGANSLVTTVWRVSDHESATLMESYYQRLKKGLPKDEALRQAKLSYVENASGNRAHPFYWAAFVTIGDMEPLHLSDYAWMWWLLVLLLPAGYGTWRWLQKKNAIVSL